MWHYAVRHPSTSPKPEYQFPRFELVVSFREYRLASLSVQSSAEEPADGSGK